MNKKSSLEIIYTVEIPSIIERATDLKTQAFSNEDPFIAREKALRYLSEIMMDLVEKKILQLKEFVEENSTELRIVKNLKTASYFFKEHGFLDFKRIKECQINYSFEDYIDCKSSHTPIKRWNTVIHYHDFLRLTIHENQKNIERLTLLEIRNSEEIDPTFIEEAMLRKYFLLNKNKIIELDEIVLMPLNSDEPFLEKLKFHKMRELFYDDDRKLEKEILTTNKFKEIERIYLSFLNRHQGEKYLFVPDEMYYDFSKIILIALEREYPSEDQFDFFLCLTIAEEKYWIFRHKTKAVSQNFIYSKQGKLYFRTSNGTTEMTEETSYDEIFPNCFKEFQKKK